MRFLADQDVYAGTVDFLRGLGQDVLTARQVGASQVSDMELLALAEKSHRILITRDRDFGALVFQQRRQSGVFYVRIRPTTMDSCHEELQRVLVKHTPDELMHSFVVIEPGRHRIRSIFHS